MGGRGAKDTTTIGDLTELEVATALARAGMRVLRPLSAGLRYDLAVDNGDGTVLRIQCKSGILRGRRPLVLVPITAVATACTARLRLAPTRNGQEKRVRRARDYEIGHGGAYVKVTPALLGNATRHQGSGRRWPSRRS